jgi:hypothetical protein
VHIFIARLNFSYLSKIICTGCRTNQDSFTPLIAALLPLPEVTVLYDCNLVLFACCNFSRGFPTKFCTYFLYAASKLCVCLLIISFYSPNLILNATLQGISIHPSNTELGRCMWKAKWLLTTHLYSFTSLNCINFHLNSCNCILAHSYQGVWSVHSHICWLFFK